MSTTPYFKVDAPVDVNEVIVRASATSAPTVSSGAGVPSASNPNGSLYMRTDATNGDDAVYMRVAGAWVPILGQTA